MSSYTTVGEKNLDLLRLKGIKITPRMINASMRGLAFEDTEGSVILVEQQGYSDFTVMVPKKPEVKRWRVTAKSEYLGKVDLLFCSKDRAEQAAVELEKTAGITDLDWEEVSVDLVAARATIDQEAV